MGTEKENPAAVDASGVPGKDQLGGTVNREFSSTRSDLQSANAERVEYLTAAMRVGRARLHSLMLELDFIGVNLAQNHVTPDEAAEWLVEVGLYDFIIPGRPDA